MATKRLGKTALDLLARAARIPRIGVCVQHGVDRTRGPYGRRAVEAANELERLHLVVAYRDGASHTDWKRGRSSLVYSRSLHLRPSTILSTDGTVVLS